MARASCSWYAHVQLYCCAHRFAASGPTQEPRAPAAALRGPDDERVRRKQGREPQPRGASRGPAAGSAIRHVKGPGRETDAPDGSLWLRGVRAGRARWRVGQPPAPSHTMPIAQPSFTAALRCEDSAPATSAPLRSRLKTGHLRSPRTSSGALAPPPRPKPSEPGRGEGGAGRPRLLGALLREASWAPSFTIPPPPAARLGGPPQRSSGTARAYALRDRLAPVPQLVAFCCHLLCGLDVPFPPDRRGPGVVDRRQAGTTITFFLVVCPTRGPTKPD